LFQNATHSLVLCVSLSIVVLGCGSPDPGNDDMGTGTRCESNVDCTDGNACNGLELCAPANASANALGCISGAPVVCTTPDTCNPTSGMCVSPCDLDSDGVESVSCGGADCDDEDANRFPGNPETCTNALGALDPETLLHDEDCDSDTLGNDRDEDGFFRQECGNPQSNGVTLFGVDCDDDNDLRRPGLVEVCDGLDNDCVGGLNFPGEDNDGDGYADCVDLMGQANFDCNDADPAVHPNAPEACDGLDSDCDGYVEDADNDGFVAVGAACTGGSMPATDCDDDRAETNPDAAETCNGVDDDCSDTDDDNNAIASCAAIVRSGEPLCAGGCTVTCDDGFADCDGLAASGCEVDTQRSARDCGSCGNVCPFGCRSGECVRAAQITAGSGHACALLETGGVMCWGSNYSGALGSGEAGDQNEHSPVGVENIDGTSDERRAVRVEAGDATTCAVMADGRVLCWGDDEEGKLGDGVGGAGARSLVPVPVPGIDGVTQVAIDVAVSGFHACAVLEGGYVWCWGLDANALLGHGNDTEEVYGPVPVSGLGGANPRAAQVTAGELNTCVLLETGAVRCWGVNGVGSGTTARQPLPVPVIGIDGVQSRATSVDTGYYNGCARLDTGALTCWAATPAVVTGLDGVSASVSQASGGGGHICAVIDGGAVVCWGQDTSGEVGDGPDDGAMEPLPTPVVGLDGTSASATQVASGQSFSCALLTTGQVHCWGSDVSGQLGDGSDDNANESAPVPMDATSGVRHVVTTQGGTCAALESGAALCWGGDTTGRVGDGDDDEATEFAPVPVVGLDGVAGAALEVHTGGHSCALMATGAVMCWGSDALGQLGNGAGGPAVQHAPVGVVGLDGTASRAVALAVGDAHTCAVLDTGSVRCWGLDERGQVGDGGSNAASISSPVTVAGLDGSTDRAIQVSAGAEHSCALLESGAVRCWGDNVFGQLGHGSVNTSEGAPVSVAGFDGVSASATQISAGWQHTCAVSATGDVRCWGSDMTGQLGDGDDDEASERSPVPVLDLGEAGQEAVVVSCGFGHTCATTATGRVVCWGWNGLGALGTGEAEGAVRHSPASVVGLSEANSALSVSAGGLSTCAPHLWRGLVCWGNDNDGEVGDGNGGSIQYTPVRVQFP
jgi:alpha-tubulin suppressor-like RCC1 family protein